MINETNNKSSKNYSVFKEVISNFSAGILLAYAIFPIEALKKLRQNTGLGLVNLYRNKMQTSDGKPYKFYRGLSVYALNIIPTTFTQLTVKSKLDEKFEGASVSANIVKSISSGVVAAGTGTVVENCIVRQQELKVDSLKKGMKDIYQHRGLTGFWKSYPLIATRDGIYTFCMLWANPEIQKYVHQHFPGKANETIALLTIGALGTVISHPCDVMATRMQRTHDPMTIRQAYLDVIKTFGGYQGFFKGFSYRMVIFTTFSNGVPYFKQKTEGFLDRHAKPLLLSAESQVLTKNKQEERDQSVKQQPTSCAKFK